MKLRELSLHQVGPHQGRVLTEVPDGLVIVYGPNEIGKSSVLAGIRGMLFREATTADKPILPSSGAKGHAVLETEDGQRYQVERVLSSRRAPKIVDPVGRIMHGEEALKVAFPELESVENFIYNSIFTFQLEELREFRDSAGKLQNRIYTVGMLGNESPIEIEQKLRDAAKEIFNANKLAKNPKLIGIIQEIEFKGKELRELGDTPQAYMALQEQLNRLREERDGLAQTLKQVQQRVLALELQQRVLPVYRELMEIRALLESFLTLPSVTIEDGTEIIRKHQEAETEVILMGERMAALKEIAAELDNLRIDEPLVNLVEPLETLEIASAQIETELLTAEELLLQAEIVQEDAKSIVKQLSSNVWPPHLLRTVDVDSATIRQLQSYQRSLADATSQLRDVQTKATISAANLQDKADELSSALIGEFPKTIEQVSSWLANEQKTAIDRDVQLQLDDEILDNLTHQIAACEDTSVQRAVWEKQWTSVSAGKSRDRFRQLMRLFLMAITLLSLIGVVMGLVYQQTWATTVTVVVWGVSVGIVLRSKLLHKDQPLETDGVDVQLTTLREREAQQQDAVMRLAQALQTVSNYSPLEKATQIALRQQIRRQRDGISKRLVQLQYISTLSQGCEAARRLGATDDIRLEKVQREYRNVLLNWETFCRELGLIGYLSPTDVIEDIRLVGQWRSFDDRFKVDCQHVLQRISRTVQFLMDVRRLLQPLSLDEDYRDDENFGINLRISLSNIRNEFTQAKHRVDIALKNALIEREKKFFLSEQQERCKCLEKSIEMASKAVEGLQSDIAAKLQIYELASVNALSEVLRKADERQSLEMAYQVKLRLIHAVCTSQSIYEEMQPFLNEASEILLSNEVTQLEEQLREGYVRQSDLEREVWDIEKSCSVSATRLDSTDLQWEIEKLKSQRESLAKRWAAYTVGQWLIQSARILYESNRQPQALRRASHIVQQITSGRYRGLAARLGEKLEPIVFAVDSFGQEWSLQNLSRGTREQIYLALRLALIRDYADRDIRLPIVFDDVMVNFDVSRLEAFYSVLVEASQHGQILYFTCQPQLVEMAKRMKNAHVIDLGEPHVVSI